MSTKQLVVLWYGAILMFVLLLVKVSSLITIGIGAGLLLILLIYSLSRHHKAHKGQLVLAIGLPMMLFGIGGFVLGGSVDNPSMYWESSPVSLLPTSEIQVLDTHVRHSFLSDTISGKIQNNSSATVQSLTLRVLFGGEAKTAENWHVKISNLNIPPGSSAPFSEKVGDFHLSLKKNWPWSFQVLAVEGQ